MRTTRRDAPALLALACGVDGLFTRRAADWSDEGLGCGGRAALAALLGQVLSEAGHVPTLTQNGDEALAAARRGGFDVLLLDWALPSLNGPEIVAALRAEGHVTPALLLTARTGVDDRVTGLDAGWRG